METTEVSTSAAILKWLRTVEDLTQKDVADACEVTPSNVGRWEQGLYSPSFEQLSKILSTFGYEIQIVPITEEEDNDDATDETC